jgi:uncharacterized protein YbbK (DUF523 family)
VGHRERRAGRLSARVLVSACLLGEPVRYDGGCVASGDPILRRWQAEGRLVPFCPEVAGGLPVPRPPADIAGARVLTRDGCDVTAEFESGARLALEAAQANNALVAVLKSRSPSCDAERGWTAALLRRNGIAVFTEHEIPAAAARLEELLPKVSIAPAAGPR